jgi:hypothetical protein
MTSVILQNSMQMLNSISNKLLSALLETAKLGSNYKNLFKILFFNIISPPQLQNLLSMDYWMKWSCVNAPGKEGET